MVEKDMLGYDGRVVIRCTPQSTKIYNNNNKNIDDEDSDIPERPVPQ